MRVRALGLAASSLAVAIAGCSLSSAPFRATTPSSSQTVAATGTLTGLVRLYGGPLNPTTGKMALNGSPGPDWPVKVLAGATSVAEAKSDAAGRFRFHLAPGRYTLGCAQAPSILVVAGQTVDVDCVVPVP